MHRRTSLLKEHQHQKKKVVVNLSKWKLNENEEQVLSLGMNFTITPKEIPTDKVIARTESLARYLSLEAAIEARRLVKDCLVAVCQTA